MYIYIYNVIYIYIERERDRDIDIYIYIYVSNDDNNHKFIVYIHIYTYDAMLFPRPFSLPHDSYELAALFPAAYSPGDPREVLKADPSRLQSFFCDVL